MDGECGRLNLPLKKVLICMCLDMAFTTERARVLPSQFPHVAPMEAMQTLFTLLSAVLLHVTSLHSALLHFTSSTCVVLKLQPLRYLLFLRSPSSILSLFIFNLLGYHNLY